MAGILHLLVLGSFAQSQTTPAAAAKPTGQNAAAKNPAKATGELPTPTPANEAGPLAPSRNPFPKSGLGIQRSPSKENPAPSDAGDTAQEPGYFGAITDDHQKLPGVRIVEVVGGGPAEVAGLRTGDVITSVNDQPIREMADLAKIFVASHAGQLLKIGYQRGATLSTPGRVASLSVTLGKRPAEKSRRYAQFGRIDEDAVQLDEGGRASGMLLGVRTAPLDLSNQRRLGVPIQAGAVVLDVVPGSPAALASIPRDAVIVSLNGLLIDSPDALTQEILKAGPGAEVELGYYLGRDQIKRRIELGGNPQTGDAYGNPPGGLPPGPPSSHDASTAARIQRLEQQVHELQRRIEVLEQQLQKQN